MWEERGGGKSLYLPAIYPCASQHQQPAVSTQSGPGWNEATHGILQVKGFFIRFKIESLLACFRGQNADNNRPQKLCNMDTMIYFGPLSMILARPHHTHHMSSTVYLYITISHGPSIQNMTNYSYNRGKSGKNNA